MVCGGLKQKVGISGQSLSVICDDKQESSRVESLREVSRDSSLVFSHRLTIFDQRDYITCRAFPGSNPDLRDVFCRRDVASLVLLPPVPLCSSPPQCSPATRTPTASRAEVAKSNARNFSTRTRTRCSSMVPPSRWRACPTKEREVLACAGALWAWARR